MRSHCILRVSKLHQSVALALLAGPAGSRGAAGGSMWAAGPAWLRQATLHSSRQRQAAAPGLYTGTGQTTGARRAVLLVGPQSLSNRVPPAPLPGMQPAAARRRAVRQEAAPGQPLSPGPSAGSPHLSSTRCTSETSPYASNSCCRSASVAAFAGERNERDRGARQQGSELASRRADGRAGRRVSTKV